MDKNRVKNHFEEEASEYDLIIKKLIPNYALMVAVLVSILPFDKQQSFSVVDLGCGTGTISRAVKDSFPNAKVTCFDIAKNMLDIAKEKIGGDTELIQADFNTLDFPNQYDAVVSSLALHHLEMDADKLRFYKKIFAALNTGGIFINIDVVHANDTALQNVYIKKWKEFMIPNTSRQEVEQKWLPNYYAEDWPTDVVTHLEMLKLCGFTGIDVVYKYYNFAVYCGRKA